MSDYFGPGQQRVLNVTDRSLDQVIFQQSRPPLSSEWNLINQICDFKAQESTRVNQPSGWLKVGTVKDTGATDGASELAAEQKARSGQVLTSLTYGSNKLRLVCRELSNVAVVNGWPIIVQKPAALPMYPAGANDIDTNIELTLPPVSSVYRYDIVFLEVWRKLVSSTDPIYPYGNVQAVPLASNEIMWDVVGAETTKRVQIQYRIRTYTSDSYNTSVDPAMYPEGLGWSNVKPVGGNTEGSYVTNAGLYFKSAGIRDAGLYIAGEGTEAHKEALNTVDGFVYAIPMFLVYRRGAGYPFSPSSVHNSLAVYGDAGSDRPDNKFADIVYADDVVDLRHQLITSGKDLESILQESFRKLVTNELKTSLNQGFTTSNQRVICSGGSTLLKVDQLNGHSSFIPNIGNGCLETDFKRRVYSNAQVTSDHNIYRVTTPLGGWVSDTIPVSSFFNSSLGSIASIDGLYYIDNTDPELSTEWGNVSDCDLTDPTQIVINPSSNIIGTSYIVYMEFTFEYSASKGGFYDVPKEFYEVRKNSYQPIATRDQNVPVKFNNSGDLISGTVSDYLKYCGGNYTENYEFGHDYVHYLNVSSSYLSITCSGGKFNGYPILGIKSIQIKSGGVYGDPEAFTVQRTVDLSSNVNYSIQIITVISSPTDILITMHTGCESAASSFKYFELSKQGRGVIDIYETILVEAPMVTSGTYLLDTGDKPIIAIASYKSMDTSFLKGIPFVYDSDGNRVDAYITPPGGGLDTQSVNNYLPVLSNSGDDNYLPTRIVLKTAGSFDSILVPVVVHSYVSVTEDAYSFYYKFNPYQGLLTDSSVAKGKIEKEGSAVITTEGSGSINNYGFGQGTISINKGERVATRSGGSPWNKSIKAGDYLNVYDSDNEMFTPYLYRILYVGSDNIGTDAETKITLAELFNEDSISSEMYNIVRLDTPENNVSNVIDVMPTYTYDEFNGIGSEMNLGGLVGSTLEVRSKESLQSPLDTIVNDFQLGLSKPSTSRGRTFFRLSEGENDFVKLGVLTPYIKYGTLAWTADNGYKKVYQAYLYNQAYVDNGGVHRDLTGKVYMLVVSSETSQNETQILLSGFSDRDAVDIFELVGRPIIKTV